MISIGIDPGIAHCGFAALDEDSQLLACAVFTSKRDKKRKGDTQARLAEMLLWVQKTVSPIHYDFDNCLAAVEWPMVGGRNQGALRATQTMSTAQTFAAAGALIGLLAVSMPVLTPLPASWRAAVRPKTKTADLHAEIERLYSVSKLVGKTKAPHAIDAIGLALFGMLKAGDRMRIAKGAA